MSETTKVIGFMPIEQPTGQARQAARAILADAVDVQLAIGDGALRNSPSSPERHAVFEGLHRIQRAAQRLLLETDNGQNKNDASAAAQVLAGYRMDLDGLIRSAAGLLHDAAVDTATDSELRKIGLASEMLATRVAGYLDVKAICG